MACTVVCGIALFATITQLGSLELGLKWHSSSELPAQAAFNCPDIQECPLLGKPEDTARWCLAQGTIQFQASPQASQGHRHSWTLASATGEAVLG